jgi:SAM-dependent methyltransferase
VLRPSNIFIGICYLIGKERCLWFAHKIAWLSRYAANRAHLLVFYLQWALPPSPEWQDQLTTHYTLWEILGQPFLAERGAMSLLAIAQDAVVLELCCGEGYYTRFYHAGRAKSVTAVDINPAAIAFAKKYHRAPNVVYLVRDILKEIPKGEYDAIIWDGAIHYFTPEQIQSLLVELRTRLKPGGILAGWTLGAAREATDCHHQYAFRSKQDLLRFLTPHFVNATVYESVWEDKPGILAATRRDNLYFFASDGPLPFDPDCPNTARHSNELITAAANHVAHSTAAKSIADS